MGKEIFTTFEISQFCNVFITTVANWIDEGKLPAYRTPGGHRRVVRRDLLNFLEKYGIPIPEALLANDEKKILVVDDNPDMVDIIVQALQRSNPHYIIRTANNGFEAGKQVVTFRPHVAILDVVLPGLDGLQLVQNLRKDPLTKPMHVIVITGHDERSTRKEFQNLDVDAYMEKPLSLDLLVKRVSEVLKADSSKEASSSKEKS